MKFLGIGPVRMSSLCCVSVVMFSVVHARCPGLWARWHEMARHLVAVASLRESEMIQG